MENPQIPLNLKYPLVRAHALVEKSRISQAIEEVIGKRLTDIEKKLDNGASGGSGGSGGDNAKLKKERDEAVKNATDAKIALDKCIDDLKKKKPDGGVSAEEFKKKEDELKEALDRLKDLEKKEKEALDKIKDLEKKIEGDKEIRLLLFGLTQDMFDQWEHNPDDLKFEKYDQRVQSFGESTYKKIAKDIVARMREMHKLNQELKDAKNAGAADGADQAENVQKIQDLEAQIKELQENLDKQANEITILQRYVDLMEGEVEAAKLAAAEGADQTDNLAKIRDLDGKINALEERIAATAAARQRAKEAANKKKRARDAANERARRAANARGDRAPVKRDKKREEILDDMDLEPGMRLDDKKQALFGWLQRTIPVVRVRRVRANAVSGTHRRTRGDNEVLEVQVAGSTAHRAYLDRRQEEGVVNAVPSANLFLEAILDNKLEVDGEIIIDNETEDPVGAFDLSSLFIWM